MTGVFDSLKPTGSTTEMTPESPRRVCVLNGSCQIDQIIRGERTTLRVLPESDLPEGICQLDEAIKANSGKDTSFIGQVLFSDSKVVYQLSSKGVVEHPRSALIKLEVEGEKIVDGCNYATAYVNGRGVTSDAQTVNVAQSRVTSKGHDVSM